MAKHTSMRIQPDKLEGLKLYSTVTGVPMSLALDEALSIFLECCAAVRIEERQKAAGAA